MFAERIRRSNAFIIFVVCVSIFTDFLLMNLVVPILPYVLSDRLRLSPTGTQLWSSILLASHGATMSIGSRELAATPEDFGALLYWASYYDCVFLNREAMALIIDLKS